MLRSPCSTQVTGNVRSPSWRGCFAPSAPVEPRGSACVLRRVGRSPYYFAACRSSASGSSTWDPLPSPEGGMWGSGLQGKAETPAKPGKGNICLCLLWVPPLTAVMACPDNPDMTTALLVLRFGVFAVYAAAESNDEGGPVLKRRRCVPRECSNWAAGSCEGASVKAGASCAGTRRKQATHSRRWTLGLLQYGYRSAHSLFPTICTEKPSCAPWTSCRHK